MEILSNEFMAHIHRGGWDLDLVEILIAAAGGYSEFCVDATDASHFIFMNSMATRPDLDIGEPAQTCSSVILESTAFLAEDKTVELASIFSDNHVAIKQSMIGYAIKRGRDAKTEFSHLTWRLDDDKDAHVFGDGDLDAADKRYAIMTTYYMLLAELVEMSGGLQGKFLAELDLSKVSLFQCIDSQVVINPKSDGKRFGFIDDEDTLARIYRDYNINFTFCSLNIDFRTNKKPMKRYIKYIDISPKCSDTPKFPIRFFSKKLYSMTFNGNSIAKVDLINNEEIDVNCNDNSIVDMAIRTKRNLHIEISGEAKLSISGPCNSAYIDASDNCLLIATRLKAQATSARGRDFATIFVNSPEFYCEVSSQSNTEMAVNNTFIPPFECDVHLTV